MNGESSIPEAKPPIGLTTGSVEGATGLSAKQRVARAYEEDLSGAKGPDARFDAINELIDTRVREAIDGITFSSADGTQISGRGGFFTAKSAKSRIQRGTATSSSREAKPWDLAGAPDAFTIPKPGRIYTNYSDADSLVTIEDWDLEFSIGAGDLVWVELTFDGGDPTLPVFTLKAGTPPTEWPTTVDFAEPPEAPSVIAAYFELYEGVTGTMPAYEWGTQYDGFWIRKSFRHGDSVLIWGSHELDDEFTGVPIPILAPR